MASAEEIIRAIEARNDPMVIDAMLASMTPDVCLEYGLIVKHYLESEGFVVRLSPEEIGDRARNRALTGK